MAVKVTEQRFGAYIFYVYWYCVVLPWIFIDIRVATLSTDYGIQNLPILDIQIYFSYKLPKGYSSF